jgi:hypothetical protein
VSSQTRSIDQPARRVISENRASVYFRELSVWMVSPSAKANVTDHGRSLFSDLIAHDAQKRLGFTIVEIADRRAGKEGRSLPREYLEWQRHRRCEIRHDAPDTNIRVTASEALHRPVDEGRGDVDAEVQRRADEGATAMHADGLETAWAKYEIE